MAVRRSDLPEVSAETYGIRVLVRARPDARNGNLELVASVPERGDDGKIRTRRKRVSAGTKDAEEAGRAAVELARALAKELGIGAAKQLERRFFSGGDVTDMEVLDYYEEQVLPGLKPSYKKYAKARIKVLRLSLQEVAEDGSATALRAYNQGLVDRFTRFRLAKGALHKNGSGEWTGEPIDKTTVAKDLNFLSRAINAARSYQAKDADGRWVAPVQYNPFEDQTKRIRLPEPNSVTSQPIMDHAMHEAMLGVADEFDQNNNFEYERLGYDRYPGYTPRCPLYTRTLLTLARQGRRRQAIAALVWGDIYWPDEPERLASIITEVLAIRTAPAEAIAAFPHGLILWRRDSDKKDYLRVAPMPRYVLDSLRAFHENHPHRGTPSGPLFYKIRDGNMASSASNLADWFPRIQALAGIEHVHQEGWHMWRRLFRQERHGHISNKIVAYCGGWSRLNAVHELLDVDESDTMNRHYLQVLLKQMYACMLFDATRVRRKNRIAGVSEEVMAQLSEEGYLAEDDLEI